MIRTANINDIYQMSTIIVSNWKEAYKKIIDKNFLESVSEEKYISIFTNIIEKSLEQIIVYEENNEILGLCSGNIINNKYDAQIIGLYVKQSFHGKGIGRKLFNTMKNYFIENHCKNMIIWTLKGVKNNLFYGAMGGVIKEKNDLEIGEKKYQGIGYFFDFNEINTANK